MRRRARILERVSARGAFWILVLLGALASLPPLSIDVSLPGLPMIAAALRAPVGLIGWTLSAFVAAFGLGQLVLGPLSDRIGRRPVLIGGLSAYALAGFGCAVAGDAWVVIVLRFVQGFGACAGAVCARAIAQDLSHDRASATQRQSVVLTVNLIAPVVAPLLGAAILTVASWRVLYAAPAAGGVALLALVAAVLPETSPRRAGAVAASYLRVLRLPRTPGFALQQFSAFFGFFALITGSSLVLIAQLHVARPLYALAFALSSLGLIAGATVAGRLARRAGAERLIATGAGIVVAGGALGAVLQTQWPSAPGFVAAMALYAFGYGLLMPGTFATMLSAARADAGLAAGVLGASQMVGGAVGSALLAALPGPPSTQVALVAAAGALGVAGGYALSRRGARPPRGNLTA